MNDYENFIGIYDNVFSAEECDEIIEYFNTMESRNLVLNSSLYSKGKKTLRNDSSVFMMEPTVFRVKATGKYLHMFVEKFKECYDDYTSRFDILHQNVAKHGILGLKVQKTLPGGGYHEWHFENATMEDSGRILTMMLYLNDIAEGGETEFLYYKKRVKPVKGRLLIWPSGFTHTHRGNPPLSETKFILTGWVDLLE